MKKLSSTVITTALICLLVSVFAFGQSHRKHEPGMSHGQVNNKHPVESGQSAFAALAEIVILLEADASTDWSHVSIDALRTHLVDMNQLTLYSTVISRQVDQKSVEFTVTGQGRTHQAIMSMVPRHAEMVSQTTPWDIMVTEIPDGVSLIIEPDSSEALRKIKALGFFGFMTIGSHHQAHHLQMASLDYS
jgi:hypothetical protein